MISSADGTRLAVTCEGAGPAWCSSAAAWTTAARTPRSPRRCRRGSPRTTTPAAAGAPAATPDLTPWRGKPRTSPRSSPAAGGAAHLHGFSSGGALAHDDRDAALKLFMRLAGAGEEDIAGAASSPVWPTLLTIAHTLPYDAACLGDGEPPTEDLARITRPTLVATGAVPDPHMGGLRPGFFDSAADVIAAHVPNATRRTVEGQSHVADSRKIALLLRDFFTAGE